jgi:hypothetical protein
MIPMSETKFQGSSRDQIVATISEFASISNGNPDSLDSNNTRLVYADKAFMDWADHERRKAIEIGTLEAKLSANLSISTLYLDAGFNDPDYIDDVINYWLVEDEQTASVAGLTAMAEQILRKRKEFGSNIRVFRR